MIQRQEICLFWVKTAWSDSCIGIPPFVSASDVLFDCASMQAATLVSEDAWVGACLTPTTRPIYSFQNHAVFAYYPIVTSTELSEERGGINDAQIEEAGVAFGGGTHARATAVGGDRPTALPTAGDGILVALAPGEYQTCDLACRVEDHPLPMRVTVGIVVNMAGEGMEATGKLRLLGVREISGNKILVLRQPRLSRPVMIGEIDWPCETRDIIELDRTTVGP